MLHIIRVPSKYFLPISTGIPQTVNSILLTREALKKLHRPPVPPHVKITPEMIDEFLMRNSLFEDAEFLPVMPFFPSVMLTCEMLTNYAMQKLSDWGLDISGAIRAFFDRGAIPSDENERRQIILFCLYFDLPESAFWLFSLTTPSFYVVVHMDFSYCKLSSGDIDKISSRWLPMFLGKVALDFSGNAMGNENAKKLLSALSQAPECIPILIDLEENSLDDEIADALYHLLEMHRELFKLNLCRNELTDKCAHILASAIEWHPLTTLDLRYNLIGNSGANSLVEAQKRSGFIELHLENKEMKR